jgi:mannose/cellobiose epimerase-like protein (N-acyl-D-glucosamine 2-epimerase family)
MRDLMRIARQFPRFLEKWPIVSSAYRFVGKSSPPVEHPLARQDLLRAQETLERILRANIIPFWYPHALDSEEGGYSLNHDLHGKWKGRANKGLVTQARTVWFFSRLAGTRYGTKEHLKAAEHGYDFLRNQMWDKDFGGFYWQVDSSGRIAPKPDKHLYGQAFGLYALSEYAKVSGDSSAATLAHQLFNLFETHAHDPQCGGYRESFKRDWSPASPDRKSYMGTSPDIKLMNTHLHLMESLTRYYLLKKDPTTKERLVELIFVNSNTVLRKNIGACTDRHSGNWEPLRGSDYDRVCYGHDVENVWLLAEACRAVGIPDRLFMDLYRSIFNYALRYGFDRKNGGFYDSGPFNVPADRRDKICWVQAEGLIGCLRMYRLTGEEVYWNDFSQTLDWIVKYQMDWEHGDWYQRVALDGKPTGMEEAEWKSPYHNGRAIIECLESLPCAS